MKLSFGRTVHEIGSSSVRPIPAFAFALVLVGFVGSSLRAQPTVRQIYNLTDPITAVRNADGNFVAVTEKGAVYISRDGSSWQLRFQAPEPLADVVFANGRYVLQLPTSRRAGVDTKPVTWTSTDGSKWTELRGPAALGIRTIGEKFVTLRTRYVTDEPVYELLESADAETWVTHTTIPAQFARFSGETGRGYLHRGRLYEGTGDKVRSTDDLKTWRDEFTVPAPAPGKERELAPVFASAGETLIAATMVAVGEGPVRVYRKHLDAAWQRITPDSTWTYLNSIKTVGSMFVATAYRDKLRVSTDGLRWKVVADMSGTSHLFAADDRQLVFGGRTGQVAILPVNRTWTELNDVPRPSYATGPNWETVHQGQTADEILAGMETVFRITRDPTGMQEQLQQAIALADTASSGTKMRLAEILLMGSLGIPKDEARGMRLLTAAADAGNGLAKLAHAQVLLAGTFGVTKDEGKANALVGGVVRSVDTAPREVKHQIATLYARGGMFGVTRNLPRAIALMTAAADEGLPVAQFEVGRALLQGAPEVPANPARAVHFLSNASGNGIAPAAGVLGQAYEQGVGVTRDLAEAAKWYQAAVERGMKEAAPALQRVQAGLATAGASGAAGAPANSVPNK